MQVFNINDLFRFHFHLYLGEKQFKKYAEKITKNGGEIESRPSDDVFTFTTRKLHDKFSEAYDIKFVDDCIDAGKILDIGKYTLDKREDYGCPFSLLFFGEKRCPGFELLQKVPKTSSAAKSVQTIGLVEDYQRQAILKNTAAENEKISMKKRQTEPLENSSSPKKSRNDPSKSTKTENEKISMKKQQMEPHENSSGPKKFRNVPMVVLENLEKKGVSVTVLKKTTTSNLETVDKNKSEKKGEKKILSLMNKGESQDKRRKESEKMDEEIKNKEEEKKEQVRRELERKEKERKDERRELEKNEKERKEEERRELERKEKERKEEERRELERKEKERKEEERRELERKEKEREKERIELIIKEQEKERERIEKLEREKIEELKRLGQKRIERLEQELLERERTERERVENLVREKVERLERLERERLENLEKIGQENLERLERIERERKKEIERQIQELQEQKKEFRERMKQKEGKSKDKYVEVAPIIEFSKSEDSVKKQEKSGTKRGFSLDVEENLPESKRSRNEAQNFSQTNILESKTQERDLRSSEDSFNLEGNLDSDISSEMRSSTEIPPESSEDIFGSTDKDEAECENQSQFINEKQIESQEIDSQNSDCSQIPSIFTQFGQEQLSESQNQNSQSQEQNTHNQDENSEFQDANSQIQDENPQIPDVSHQNQDENFEFQDAHSQIRDKNPQIQNEKSLTQEENSQIPDVNSDIQHENSQSHIKSPRLENLMKVEEESSLLLNDISRALLEDDSETDFEITADPLSSKNEKLDPDVTIIEHEISTEKNTEHIERPDLIRKCPEEKKEEKNVKKRKLSGWERVFSGETQENTDSFEEMTDNWEDQRKKIMEEMKKKKEEKENLEKNVQIGVERSPWLDVFGLP